VTYAVGLVDKSGLRGEPGGACAIVEAASSNEVAEKFNGASFHPRRLPAASDDRSTEAVFQASLPEK